MGLGPRVQVMLDQLASGPQRRCQLEQAIVNARKGWKGWNPASSHLIFQDSHTFFKRQRRLGRIVTYKVGHQRWYALPGTEPAGVTLEALT